MIHGRITRSTYYKIIDSVKSRLSGWYANTLSLVDRVTLVKSVILAIPFLHDAHNKNSA